jgi:hypothetical protein
MWSALKPCRIFLIYATMRKFTFLLTLLPSLLFGQSKSFELGISVGNNGQLDKTLNDFYFWGHETAYLDDSYQNETTNLKFSASARYFFSDDVSARLKFGKADRKDFYTKINPMEYIDYSIKQSVSNLSPSVCFSKTIDKLEIMTGLEIPMFFVNDFTFISNYRQMPDSVTVTMDGKAIRTMPGGFMWGIINFIGVKYYFTKWFGFGTEIDYGLLFADIGGKMKSESKSTLPTPTASYYEYDKNYKKTFFSTPEVSLGLFLRMGGK